MDIICKIYKRKKDLNKKNINIEILWIAGHASITGNELADKCAKEAAQEAINRKNNLILVMTPEKQDKTSELSKHWSADSTPARNEVIIKTTYPVKSVKCDKICSNY